MNRLIVWAPLVVIALILTALGVALLAPSPGHDIHQGRPLPQMELQPFRGGRGDYDPAAVEGPYLLNVWGSWCPPCRVEHPVLMALHASGTPIYGIVYRDRPDRARAFLAELGDPFAGLADDPEGRAAFELGVTGAPETFVIDAEGRIRARWRGALTDIVWLRHLEPAWREAGGAPVDHEALREASRW